MIVLKKAGMIDSWTAPCQVDRGQFKIGSAFFNGYPESKRTITFWKEMKVIYTYYEKTISMLSSSVVFDFIF